MGRSCPVCRRRKNSFVVSGADRFGSAEGCRLKAGLPEAARVLRGGLDVAGSAEELVQAPGQGGNEVEPWLKSKRRASVQGLQGRPGLMCEFVIFTTCGEDFRPANAFKPAG